MNALAFSRILTVFLALVSSALSTEGQARTDGGLETRFPQNTKSQPARNFIRVARYQQGSDGQIIGIWKGKYKCRFGWTGTTLTVRRNEQSGYDARFQFYPLPGRRNVRSGEFTMRVSYNEQTGKVRLSPKTWIKRPRGYHMITITGRTGEAGKSLIGKVRHSGCSIIVLRRIGFPEERNNTTEIAGRPSNTLNTAVQDERNKVAIAGKWKGFFACRWGLTAVNLDIKKIRGRSRYRIFLTHYRGRGQGASKGPGNGKKLFTGGRSGSNGEFEFEFKFRKTLHLGKGPGWTIRSFNIETTDSPDKLTGGASDGGSCSLMELNRIGAKIAKKAPSSPARQILGEWEGTLTCRGRDTVDGTLSIKQSLAGRYGGLLRTFTSYALSGGSGAVRLVGQQSSPPRFFEFAPTKTLYTGIRGVNPKGFNTELTNNGKTLTGTFLKGRCSSFSMTRVTRTSPSRITSVSSPADNGTFHSSKSSMRRCKSIVVWTNKLRREFPKLDLNHTVLERVYPKAVLLFADDDFVPVFGRPYDSFSSRGLKSISRQIERRCYRDPLMRQNLDGMRQVLGGLGRLERGSFSRPAIVNHIRKIRVLRNQLLSGAQLRFEITEPAARMKRLAAARKLLTKQNGTLWPSEQSSAIARITKQLALAARLTVKRQLDEISALLDPVKRVSAIGALNASQANGAMTHMDASEQAQTKKRLDKLRKDLSEPAMAQILSHLATVAESFDGLRKIDQLKKSAEPIIALANKSDMRHYNSQFKSRRNSILNKLIDRDMVELRAIPDSKIGLSQTAAWQESFNKKYSTYSSTLSVGKAQRIFAEDRNKRLLDSLTNFNTELEAIDLTSEDLEKQVRALLKRYLPLSGDKKLLVYAKYMNHVARLSDRLDQRAKQHLVGQLTRKNANYNLDTMPIVLSEGWYTIYIKPPFECPNLIHIVVNTDNARKFIGELKNRLAQWLMYTKFGYLGGSPFYCYTSDKTYALTISLLQNNLLVYKGKIRKNPKGVFLPTDMAEIEKIKIAPGLNNPLKAFSLANQVWHKAKLLPSGDEKLTLVKKAISLGSTVALVKGIRILDPEMRMNLHGDDRREIYINMLKKNKGLIREYFSYVRLGLKKNVIDALIVRSKWMSVGLVNEKGFLIISATPTVYDIKNARNIRFSAACANLGGTFSNLPLNMTNARQNGSWCEQSMLGMTLKLRFGLPDEERLKCAPADKNGVVICSGTMGLDCQSNYNSVGSFSPCSMLIRKTKATPFTGAYKRQNGEWIELKSR